MVNSLQFKIEGLDVTIHSPRENIELKKSKLPTSLCNFKCECGQTTIKITKHIIKLATHAKTFVKDATTGKQKRKDRLLVGFSGVLEAAKQAKMLQNIPHSFTAWARDTENANRAPVGMHFDGYSTSKSVLCPICQREYKFKVDIAHNIERKKFPTWLDVLKDYPLKADGFTKKALARLAFVQGFGTVENMIDEVNAIADDLRLLDSTIEQLSETLEQCEFKSGFGKTWNSNMKSRLPIINKDVKKELKRTLEYRLQQIYDSSYVSFPEEDDEEDEEEEEA